MKSSIFVQKNIANCNTSITPQLVSMRTIESSFLLLGDGMMLLLVLLAFFLFICIIERAIFLHGKNIKPQHFISGITALLKNSRYNEAVTICEETPGLVPNIVKIALVFYKNAPEKMEHAVKNFITSSIPTLEKRLSLIALLGKLAPIIGCIGSCVIFANFIIHAQISTNYIQSEYLFVMIADILKIIALGLFLNLCANIGYSFLYNRVQRLINNMEVSYSEIINFLLAEIDNAQ